MLCLAGGPVKGLWLFVACVGNLEGVLLGGEGR